MTRLLGVGCYYITDVDIFIGYYTFSLQVLSEFPYIYSLSFFKEAIDNSSCKNWVFVVEWFYPETSGDVDVVDVFSF